MKKKEKEQRLAGTNIPEKPTVINEVASTKDISSFYKIIEDLKTWLASIIEKYEKRQNLTLLDLLK